MMWLGRRQIALLYALAWLVCTGFDTSLHSIPLEEIHSGGPPKDGIPAIVQPRFVDAGAATFLRPDDRVVGLAYEGVFKAYPVRILNWHEVVNDRIGTRPVAVTFCPLTASAVVFDRRLGGDTLSFGVSGRLYQSNVLVYDHQTEGLWSQLKEEAVTGRHTGTRLRALPSVLTTWDDWRTIHPTTAVLSLETGYGRDYGRDPYAGYHASPAVMFSTRGDDERLPPKTLVFGLRVGEVSKAYAMEGLAGTVELTDEVGGVPVRIEYDGGAERVTATRPDTGELLAGTVLYWFAWSAFHPQTALWKGEKAAAAGKH